MRVEREARTRRTFLSKGRVCSALLNFLSEQPWMPKGFAIEYIRWLGEGLFCTAFQFELEKAQRAIKEFGKRSVDLDAALCALMDLRPKATEPVLLHGDPLFQNLMVRPGKRVSEEHFTWIDWDLARVGNRAEDLATFTRGSLAKCHGLSGGRRLFLDAYRQHSGVADPERNVLFYELKLHIHWVCGALREGCAEEAEQNRNRLRKLVNPSGR